LGLMRAFLILEHLSKNNPAAATAPSHTAST